MFWVPTFSALKLTPMAYTFVLVTDLTERSLVNARAVPAEASARQGHIGLMLKYDLSFLVPS